MAFSPSCLLVLMCWCTPKGPDILQTKSKNELILRNFEQNQAEAKFFLSLFRQFDTANQSKLSEDYILMCWFTPKGPGILLSG